MAKLSAEHSRGAIRARLPVAAIALALLAVTSAANLQLPLFPLYGDHASTSQGLRALAFATYILGLIPTLTLLGGLSDVAGRRPVILAGLIAAGLATVVMIVSPTITMLFPARVLQGLAVAISTGACTAYLSDVIGGAQAASRAAGLTAILTALGFGGGALITSLCMALSWGSGLEPLSFWVEVILIGLAAAGLLAIPAPPRPSTAGTGRSGWMRLPSFPAGTGIATLAGTTAWAVSGVIIGLLPGELTRMGLPSWSGIALFILTGGGVLIQLSPLRPTSVRVGIYAGATCTILASVLLLTAVALAKPVLLLIAAGLTGASGFGFTYVAGLTAVSVAAGEQRARAVSGFLLASYLGFGLPIVAVGVLADHLGLVTALVVLSTLVAATWGVLLVCFARQQAGSRAR